VTVHFLVVGSRTTKYCSVVVVVVPLPVVTVVDELPAKLGTVKTVSSAAPIANFRMSSLLLLYMSSLLLL
jgi:hypothetical protein